MKNQILDEIQFDGIYSLLNKGEKVLWDGKPYFKFHLNIFRNDKSSDDTIGSMVAVLMVLFFGFLFFLFLFNIPWIGRIFFFIIFLVLSLPRLHSIYTRKRMQYLLTDQRVIFQLVSVINKEFQEIPLDEINGVVVAQEDKNYGTIFFALKNPQLITFDTYDLRLGSRRHQPTLELVENVDDVANYIRKAIRGKNVNTLL